MDSNLVKYFKNVQAAHKQVSRAFSRARALAGGWKRRVGFQATPPVWRWDLQPLVHGSKDITSLYLPAGHDVFIIIT